MASRTTTVKSQDQEPTSDALLQKNKQDLGIFGTVLGSKDNAPIYIAGALAVIALIGLIIVGIAAPDGKETPDLLKTLGGIVVSALTFIGGASSNRRDK